MDKIPSDYEAIFIDVGQGDATLIHHLPGKSSLLIDAGVDGQRVLSILGRKGELRAIFVTHWDSDHIGGVPAVIKWLSDQCQRDVRFYINFQSVYSKVSKRLRKTLEEAEEDGTITITGAFKDWPGSIEIIGGSFHILWPLYKDALLHPEDKNFCSLILRFDVGPVSLLLGGDAPGNVWPRVDQTALKAHVFRYPHHGGRLSERESKDAWSADDLISKVDPAWIIVSVGANNSYDHPSPEFREAQARHPHRQFLSTIEGNINLQIDATSGNIYKANSL